jgi:hypothetical protein
MANDYWGYQPEYREMRSHDHYRKALNGLGLHGADFLATRLARLASGLNGGPGYTPSALDTATVAEQARARAVAEGLGALAVAYKHAYASTLPTDGGKPRIVTQPKDTTRFGASHLAFVGGSNYTDLPRVRVDRLVRGDWRPYGDTTGDVELMVGFPKPADLPAYRAGSFEWKWTAAFEAFSSEIAQPDAQGVERSSTPAGTYRFVVRGHHRGASGVKPYVLRSEPFTVSPWDGVTATDLRVEPDGTVSFTAPAVDYPDSYKSPFRFIVNQRVTKVGQEYCPKCSFRPWADRGELATAYVTRGDDRVPATLGADGRWHTAEPLGEGAYIAAGDLLTREGETNGRDIR